jgi:hypothetical protein
LTPSFAPSRFSPHEDADARGNGMSKGLRITAVGAALVASTLLISGAVADAHSSDGEDGGDRTLQFDVAFSPTSYTDLGAPGFSPADVIVFNDRLLQDGEQVGHEVGSCVLVSTTDLANCTGVVTLDGRGTLTFAFENSQPPEKALAIIGGTGEFRTAGGEGTLVEAGDDTGTLTLSVDRR